MKEKLLRILKTEPSLANQSEGFLDDLADDIQSVIIRAVAPADGDPQIQELDLKVEDVYVSQFGVLLSNLYSIEPFPHKKNFYFSARMRVVKAMIQTMLLEQDNYPEDMERTGLNLKSRLAELNAGPAKVSVN